MIFLIQFIFNPPYHSPPPNSQPTLRSLHPNLHLTLLDRSNTNAHLLTHIQRREVTVRKLEHAHIRADLVGQNA